MSTSKTVSKRVEKLDKKLNDKSAETVLDGLVLDREDAQPMYAQLEHYLRERIRSGSLGPGERLPPEKTIADTFGLSRMTVRRATTILVDEGLLVRQAGRGTFVARAKVPVTAATLSSFSHAMRGIGLAVTSEVIDLRLVDAPEEVRQKLGLSSKAVFLRRLRSIDEEVMAVMSSYMAPHFLAPLQRADLTKQPLTAVMEKASGFKLTSSQDVLEASLANKEEANLLGIKKGAPVLLERGLVMSETGEPVRLSTIVYRGDRVRLSLTSHSDTNTQVRVPLKGPADPTDNAWLDLSFRLAN